MFDNNKIEKFKNLSNKLNDSYQRDVYEIDKMELTTHDKIDLKEEQKGKNDKNIFKIVTSSNKCNFY